MVYNHAVVVCAFVLIVSDEPKATQERGSHARSSHVGVQI